MSEILVSELRLPYDALSDLWNSLEKPTLNWEDLIQSKTFQGLYPEPRDVIKKVQEKSGSHPAKALMDDLTCRKTKLQDLLSGLKEIGNEKAISIIQRDLPISQDSGGRPPPSLSIDRQPVEHFIAPSSCSTPLMESGQQAKTLSNAIQESGTNEDNPACGLSLDWSMEFLPCLYWMDSGKESKVYPGNNCHN